MSQPVVKDDVDVHSKESPSRLSDEGRSLNLEDVAVKRMKPQVDEILDLPVKRNGCFCPPHCF